MSIGKNVAYIRNGLTGEMVPIKLHILAKLATARKAERNFKMWDEHWDHLDLEKANTYIKLLNEWDAAIATFSRYANIWYIARHGLSLN